MGKRAFIFVLLFVLALAVSPKEAAAYPQFLGNKVVCPVSGEQFAIGKDSKKVRYKGKVYYFCCLDCVALFSVNQKKYLQAAEEKKGDKDRQRDACGHNETVPEYKSK